MIFDSVPAELKAQNSWVAWKLELRGDKTTKVPYRVDNGALASSTDPKTWSTFQDAAAAFAKKTANYSGIGYVLQNDDPFVGVDIDHCIDASGAVSGEAAGIVALLDSYTEITPSGHGLRIFIKGHLPGSRRKKGNVEMYQGERFLTVTGNVFSGSRAEPRQEGIEALYRQIFGDDAPPTETTRRARTVSDMGFTDQEILGKMFKAQNGAKVSALWEGQWHGLYPSQSDADSALIFHLIWWTDGDPQQADTLFRQSGLMRDKWDEKHYGSGHTYGQKTVERAQEKIQNGYSPESAGTTLNTDALNNNNRINRINATVNLNNNNQQDIDIEKEKDAAGDASDSGGTRVYTRTEQPVDSVDSVESEKWPSVVPMGAHNLPAFPMGVFPPWMEQFIDAVTDAKQTPRELAAMMAMSAVSACLARRVYISPKPGWTEPVNLYTATFLDPGNRKTSIVRAVTRPIADYERIERESVAVETARAHVEKRVMEQQLKDLERKAAASKSFQDRQDLMMEAGDIQIRVSTMRDNREFRLFVDDCTPEKLVSLLSENDGRMAILTDEAGTFDLISGRYSDRPNLDVYLKSHSGETVIVDRVGCKSERVENPSLTIGMAVQPEVLRGLLAKPGLRGRGLLGRFLYCIPPERVGYRDIDAAPMDEEIDTAYYEAMTNYFSMPLTLESPKKLSLTPDAREVMRAYEKSVELQLRKDGTMGDMTDWGGKLVGAVCRIAAILHVAGFAYPLTELTYEVSAAAMYAAVRIGGFLAEHARAAYWDMRSDDDLDNARYICEWLIRKKASEVKQSEMYRAMARRFKRSEDMVPALMLLKARHYIREFTPHPADKRAHPSPVIVVNPSLFEGKS